MRDIINGFKTLDMTYRSSTGSYHFHTNIRRTCPKKNKKTHPKKGLGKNYDSSINRGVCLTICVEVTQNRVALLAWVLPVNVLWWRHGRCLLSRVVLRTSRRALGGDPPPRCAVASPLNERGLRVSFILRPLGLYSA